MTVTTSYALSAGNLVKVGDAADYYANDQIENFGATSLASGGFALASQPGGGLQLMAYDSTGHVTSNIYDSGPDDGQTDDASIAGLTNGNYVAVNEFEYDGPSQLFISMYSPGGAKIGGYYNNYFVEDTQPDVTALTSGGFAVSAQYYHGDDDQGIEVLVQNQLASASHIITISTTSDFDHDAKLTQLNNGSIAVTWTRTASGYDQVWYAVYKLDGTVVSGPEPFDSPGGSDVKPIISSLADGGFMIGYVDRSLSDTADITLAKFNEYGVFDSYRDVSNPSHAPDGSQDGNPAIARLPSGLLAVSWENNYYQNDTDLRLALFDPNTMTTVAQTSFLSTDSQKQPALAAFYGGHIALSAFNLTDHTIDLADVATIRILTGDDGVNKITAGNDMQHTLYGLGGNDSLIGGTLADTLDGGSGDDKLLGQDGNDQLFGGDGNDTLNGGTGADTMYGGAGNDTYTIDNPGDVVVEHSGEGVDLVTAGFSYQLGSNVENLTLIGNNTLTGRGNGSPNTIIGNNGANLLYGFGGVDNLSGGDGNDSLYGGAKADTLTGGSGADRFVFDTPGPSADADTVTDFVHNTDKLAFTKAAFSAFSGDTAGQPISAAEFHIGTAATAPGQHVIYDSATGALYYDSDGSGSTAQVLVATVTGHPTVSASDILVL